LPAGVIALCFLLGSPLTGSASAKTRSYLEEDKSLTQDYAAIEGAMVGVVLPGGPEHFIQVEQSTKSLLPSPQGPAVGETICRDAMGVFDGPAASCEVIISGIVHKDGELRDTVAHEVFHVFQEVMAGTLANFLSMPYKSWLIEGSASWVESDLIKSDRGARSEWTRYLRSPGKPLFSRDYDGVGFFGHMAQTGISPWKRFKAMFAATSSKAAYEAGISSNVDFLDSEASVFFREPSFGSAWNAQGANVPSKAEVNFKAPTVKITRTTPPVTLRAKPYADGEWNLSVSGLPSTESVVEVKVDSGYARLHSTHGGDVDAVNPKQVLLCTDPKGCSCPSHHADYEQFKTGDIALTAGMSEGSLTLTRRRPCEVLLPVISCETLLPDFTDEVSNAVQPLVGSPLSSTVTQGGSTDSTCAFLVKAGGSTDAEGDFRGLTAPIVSVLHASSAAGAQKYYEIISRAGAPNFLISHPKLGAESQIETKSEVGPKGFTEYSSFAMLRISNVVVYYGLYSTGGNTEASPTGSLNLLALVASRL
jgi:hypothetical protein